MPVDALVLVEQLKDMSFFVDFQGLHPLTGVLVIFVDLKLSQVEV